MKKSWKLILGVIFVISGLLNAGEGITSATWLTLAIGIVLIVLWNIDRKKAKAEKVAVSKGNSIFEEPNVHACQQSENRAPKNPQKGTSKHNPPQVTEREVPVYKLGIPEVEEGYRIKYKYNNVIATIVDDSLCAGQRVDIAPNGDVRVEDRVVGVIKNDGRLGMVEDWVERGEPFAAGVLKVNNDGTAKIYLAFYKPYELTEERICKVVGTGGAKHQEMAELLTPDELVFIDKDYETDRIYLTDAACSPFGYLSKKDAEWLETLEGDNKYYEINVCDTDYDSNGKTTVTVKISYES